MAMYTLSTATLQNKLEVSQWQHDVVQLSKLASKLHAYYSVIDPLFVISLDILVKNLLSYFHLKRPSIYICCPSYTSSPIDSEQVMLFVNLLISFMHIFWAQ